MCADELLHLKNFHNLIFSHLREIHTYLLKLDKPETEMCLSMAEYQLHMANSVSKKLLMILDLNLRAMDVISESESAHLREGVTEYLTSVLTALGVGFDEVESSSSSSIPFFDINIEA
jgi:hypothetical protein